MPVRKRSSALRSCIVIVAVSALALGAVALADHHRHFVHYTGTAPGHPSSEVELSVKKGVSGQNLFAEFFLSPVKTQCVDGSQSKWSVYVKVSGFRTRNRFRGEYYESISNFYGSVNRVKGRLLRDGTAKGWASVDVDFRDDRPDCQSDGWIRWRAKRK
jgi:hypothetical protein